MSGNRTTTTLALLILTAATSVPASAQGRAPQKCGGADIANGPFQYSQLTIQETTFNGAGGVPVATGFEVTAPSVSTKDQTDNPDVFPGNGQEPCPAAADAWIGVLEIEQVADASGNPLGTPIKLDPAFGLGLVIAGSFAVTPGSHTFGIGETLAVGVIVSNPNVSASDYGVYDVKLAAQAPGYGIGVGNGPHFFLTLREASATDTTPPVVNVTKPSGDEILGVVAVEVQAYDPLSPVATGLASMSATVSSAGGAVSNLALPLALNAALPVGAGILVTGTASFTPVGGTGTGGTTDALAFSNSSRSGIGSYVINASAVDGAGNVGAGTRNFNVKYAVAFTQASTTPPCGGVGPGSGPSCTGRFKFTVNRSSVTSDGAFMFDHTVVVKLVRSSNNAVVATHTYGSGSILSNVQIDLAAPEYQTHFRRGDIAGATGPAAYVAMIYFLDIDGNLVLQGTSSAVTF